MRSFERGEDASITYGERAQKPHRIGIAREKIVYRLLFQGDDFRPRVKYDVNSFSGPT